jgi:rare lipoprotein A
MSLRLLAIVLLAGALAACGGRERVRDGRAPSSQSGAASRPVTPLASGGDPCAVLYEHDEADYEPGGLYRRGQRDHAPAGRPDLSKIAEPVPKPEPLSRYGNSPSYTVLGKRYSVLTSTRGFRERGIASWYGAKFHGRATSSMEPYDMCQFSAAHKTLPLPSYARVTNLDNGRSVVVRVNDRGPFHEGRVVDLSYVAALKLGVYETGTARVEVEAITPSGGPAYAAAPPRIEGDIYLQVGAFGERANAETLRSQLTRAGERAEILTSNDGGRALHRVRVGPIADPARAEETKARLRLLGFVASPIVIAD